MRFPASAGSRNMRSLESSPGPTVISRSERDVKRVLLIVQESPFNTLRTSEAFRMTMGLILSENEVSILLMGDGVLNLLPLKAEAIGQPSIESYLEYFPK